MIEIKQGRLCGGGAPRLGFENWVRFWCLDVVGKEDISEDCERRHIREGERA